MSNVETRCNEYTFLGIEYSIGIPTNTYSMSGGSTTSLFYCGDLGARWLRGSRERVYMAPFVI